MRSTRIHVSHTYITICIFYSEIQWYTNAKFGEGHGTPRKIKGNCNSCGPSLLDCLYEGGGICNHSKDVGVSCQKEEITGLLMSTHAHFNSINEVMGTAIAQCTPFKIQSINITTYHGLSLYQKFPSTHNTTCIMFYISWVFPAKIKFYSNLVQGHASLFKFMQVCIILH